MIDTQLCAHGQENHIKRKEEHLIGTGQYLDRYLTVKAKFTSSWNEPRTPNRDVSLEFPVTPMLEKIES